MNLFTLSRCNHTIMIEVHGVESGKRLRLELRHRKRIRAPEFLRDHSFNPSTAMITAAAPGRKLSRGLLGFRSGHRPIMIGIEDLEQHIGALLRFRPGLVALHPSAVITTWRLRQSRCRKQRGTERQRDK